MARDQPMHGHLHSVLSCSACLAQQYDIPGMHSHIRSLASPFRHHAKAIPVGNALYDEACNSDVQQRQDNTHRPWEAS
eukprot:3313591-Amphidinium_carterae.1